MGERIELFEHWLFKMDGWFGLSILCMIINAASLYFLAIYDSFWMLTLQLLVFGLFIFFGIAAVLLLSYLYISDKIGEVKEDYDYHKSKEKKQDV